MEDACTRGWTDDTCDRNVQVRTAQSTQSGLCSSHAAMHKGIRISLANSDPTQVAAPAPPCSDQWHISMLEGTASLAWMREGGRGGQRWSRRGRDEGDMGPPLKQHKGTSRRTGLEDMRCHANAMPWVI